jgi:hypothetical protein
MRLNGREGHLGPAPAKPKKTRAERQAELKGLMCLPGGKVVVDYYFLKYTGGLPGTTAPIGAPVIQAILDHEYPDG